MNVSHSVLRCLITYRRSHSFHVKLSIINVLAFSIQLTIEAHIAIQCCLWKLEDQDWLWCVWNPNILFILPCLHAWKQRSHQGNNPVSYILLQGSLAWISYSESMHSIQCGDIVKVSALFSESYHFNVIFTDLCFSLIVRHNCFSTSRELHSYQPRF